MDYIIQPITASLAKKYITRHHYTHGCMNCPSPCFGLFDGQKLIGCIMFATPCSEAVRSSIWGGASKDSVIELHRLHILDVTPKNTESWFISRSLKLLKELRPEISGVISFADSTVGHDGIIYKATNAYRCGHTGIATFFRDKEGRLHHPRQNGHNITLEEAERRGWVAEKRGAKNRYLYILANDKREAKRLISSCKLSLDQYGHPVICQRKDTTLF